MLRWSHSLPLCPQRLYDPFSETLDKHPHLIATERHVRGRGLISEHGGEGCEASQFWRLNRHCIPRLLSKREEPDQVVGVWIIDISIGQKRFEQFLSRLLVVETDDGIPYSEILHQDVRRQFVLSRQLQQLKRSFTRRQTGPCPREARGTT